MSQPCPLTSITAPGEECTLGQNHWGGCSWEPENSWQAIPDPCPACGKQNSLEIRQDVVPGHGIRSTYRCHECKDTGLAVPARTRP